MKRFMLVAVLLLMPAPGARAEDVRCAPPSACQLWAATWDDSSYSYTTDIAVAPDDSRVYMTGAADFSTGNDYMTIALDAVTGQQLWAARFGKGGLDEPYQAEVSRDGRTLYVAGWHYYGNDLHNVVVVAYDSTTGAERWTRELASVNKPFLNPSQFRPNINSLATSLNGSTLYVVGHNHYWNPDAGDLLLLALDAETGVQRWSAAADLGADEMATGMALSPDMATIAVVGDRLIPSSGQASRDVVVALFDAATGAQRWKGTWDGPGHGMELVRSVAIAPDARVVYVAAVTNGTSRFTSTADIAVLAYDLVDGRLLWQRVYDGGNNGGGDEPWGLTPDLWGERVYVSGTQMGGASDHDSVTLAIDADTGTVLWSAVGNIYDGWDFGHSVSVAPGGHRVYVSGVVAAPSGGKMLILGYDALTGQQVWWQEWDPAWIGQSQAFNSVMDASGTRLFVDGFGFRPFGFAMAAVAYGLFTSAPFATLSADETEGPRPLSVTFSLLGIDPDGHVDGWRLDVDGDGIADYQSSTGLLPPSITHTYMSAGTFNARLTVSDDHGAIGTDDVTIIVTATSLPPVLSAIGNRSVDENEELSFLVSASDPEGDPLTYSASNLPSGANFDSSARRFSWTPSPGQDGTYPGVHFQVSDGQATDSEDIIITVANTAPPAPPVITGPAEGATLASGSVSISGAAEANSTVRVREGAAVVGTTAASGAGSFSLSASFSDGDHTITAIATDGANNESTASAPQHFAVDTTPPIVTIDSGPSGSVGSSDASFAFSASEPSSFSCSLDGDAFTACTSPKTYSGLAGAEHTFAVRGTDAVGNVSAAATRTWSIDIQAPAATITSGPAGPTTSSTATFGFTSSKADSTFGCSLDAAAFAPCVSPATYTALAEGAHTFAVRATDTAGNTGPAASRGWIVDTTAPSTSISTGPAALTNSRTASFAFTATESASFACSLDGASATACTSPASYPDLSEGAHTFSVRATDAAGNTGVGASRSWEIDGTPPDTLITSGPTGTVTSSTASFSFSATEPGASFTCSRDSGPYFACTSPATYTGLGNATHTFRVRATDAASNTDATPASRTWTVAVAAPSVPVISSPAQDQVISSAALAISGTADPGVYVTVLEGTTALRTTTTDSSGAWSTIPLEFSDGDHQLTARASDATGNLSAASAVRRFLVDTVAPAAPVIATPAEGQMLASSAVTLSGNAEPGALVSVHLGSQTIAMATADEAGKWQVDRTFADGAYQISARASDAAGNQSGAVARGFTVDTTAPAPPVIITPQEGSAQPGGVSVSGTAEPGATVKVFEGSMLLWNARADAQGGWSASVGMDTGPHTITTSAADDAGNLSGFSAPRSFNVDASRPTVAITTADRSVFPPSFTGTITGTGSDNRGVTSVTLLFRDVRGTLIATRTATCGSCGGGAHEVEWLDDPGLDLGYYIVEARTNDEAGNRSDAASIAFLRL